MSVLQDLIYMNLLIYDCEEIKDMCINMDRVMLQQSQNHEILYHENYAGPYNPHFNKNQLYFTSTFRHDYILLVMQEAGCCSCIFNCCGFCLGHLLVCLFNYDKVCFLINN